MGKGGRTISFFSRAISMASFKISTSMVFLPRIRSSSRTLALSSLTSERGTTASSKPAATRAPHSMSRLHRKSWLGWIPYFRAIEEMVFPGCSASCTMARFCSAVHLLLLSTDVMTSTGLIRLLLSDYSNNSRAITTTYFGCMSVRLKRGLLQ